MAEVFNGTPAIVTVAVWDQEGKKVEYNVCGRELRTVEAAILDALKALPDEDQNPAPKKARKQRRTKAQMAATDAAPEPEKESGRQESGRQELATAGTGGKGRTWAD